MVWGLHLEKVLKAGYLWAFYWCSYTHLHTQKCLSHRKYPSDTFVHPSLYVQPMCLGIWQPCGGFLSSAADSQ